MQIDKAKLESWVRCYGASSNSYVLLEGPKSYFLSPAVDGFLAYQLSGGTALIAGDPVCAPERADRLIRDFAAAMMRPVGAYQVSPAMLKAFREEGFDDVQIGKEAIFDLHRFTLAGGSMELVQWRVR
jgi:phosphatidylglycerol lysyltransferase